MVQYSLWYFSPVFLNGKKGFQKDLLALPPCKCFMFIFLSNNTVFVVSFGIDLHLWVFEKAEIALAEAACAISGFLKNSPLQINSKLNLKPYDYPIYNIYYHTSEPRKIPNCVQFQKIFILPPQKELEFSRDRGGSVRPKHYLRNV